MSFFNKTVIPDQWKEKYLDLLDEQEQSGSLTKKRKTCCAKR
jgi:hypothetical protein